MEVYIFTKRVIGLQTENLGQNYIKKIKSKNLPCVALDDLLISRNTLKYRNTLPNFKGKKKNTNTILKISTSQFNNKISKNRKQKNNYSINKKQKKDYSINIYSNPFSAVYKRNKKV